MAKRGGLVKSKLVRGLILGAASAAVGLALLLTGALEGIEDSTWDLRVKWFAKPTTATDDVILIFVDESTINQSIEAYGQDLYWPWPRSVYSYIVEFCREANVASLTFDFFLSDQGKKGPYDDNALMYSVEGLDRFVYATQLEKNPEFSNEWPEHVTRPAVEITGLNNLPQNVLDDMRWDRASFPHLDVMASNGGIGFANGVNDSDGVYRRYRLLNFHQDQPIPSLALAAFAAYSDDVVALDYEKNGVSVNGKFFPTDDDGNIVLRYTTPGDPDYESDPSLQPPMHTNYAAWDVLQSAIALQSGVEPVIDPSEFEGKYVLVGLTAAGLFDLRPTSVDPRAPGVTVHASMLDNLLSGEVMRDLPMWTTGLILALLTIVGALAATYAARPVSEVLLILLFLAIPLGLSFGGYFLGFWVQLVVVLISVFLAMIAANVANYATEGAEKRQIRGMFGRYLSPDVISDLEENPEALELGGREAEISIYFSDIQKFSTISTKLGPEDLVEFLNVYLTPMTNMILEEGGLIDKYEGDAIIAMWGAPRKMEDHAQRGLRSVLKCQAALDELRPALLDQIGTGVYQRIGMSSGKAIVGNMGSELRRDYTMIGDAVNLAARLEGANKAFGTYSMVSDDTINAAGGLEAVRGIGVALRELGYIAVVGREDRPVRVYEPMQPDEYVKRSDILSAYQKGIELFQAGQFADAKPVFERLANEDPAAASYVPRCDTLMANPPADWNGVWVLTEKG